MSMLRSTCSLWAQRKPQLHLVSPLGRGAIPGLLALVIAACCSGTAAAAGDPADTHPDLHLIPWPKTVERGDGYMQLSAASRIVAGAEQLQPLAEVLSAEIGLLTGLKLKVAAGPDRAGDIVLRIDKTIRAGEPILVLRQREPVRTTDGAHVITIDQQAVVTGFDYRATAEGSSTILQLLGRREGRLRLPRLTIRDWPHADYCGVLLDVARQDHPIPAIKKVVQLCRLYKTRYLQLHLTDDQGWTFPSTRYPQLGSKNHAAHGGITPRVYKLDELKELVAYADARGVTIVPEFEMPGHSSCGRAGAARNLRRDQRRIRAAGGHRLHEPVRMKNSIPPWTRSSAKCATCSGRHPIFTLAATRLPPAGCRSTRATRLSWPSMA